MAVGGDFDSILGNLAVLKKHEDLSGIVDEFLSDEYTAILRHSTTHALFAGIFDAISSQKDIPASTWQVGGSDEVSAGRLLIVGLAAFNAFLQANVTGPPLSGRSLLFSDELDLKELTTRRKECLASLDIDGLSVYQHIPHVELFCLARAIFNSYFPHRVGAQEYDSRWMRIRVNVYHQRLLSTGTSAMKLTESAVQLQTQIEGDMLLLQNEMMKPDSKYSTEEKVQFLLEKANFYIMEGLDLKAKENVQMAKSVSGFSYALSGALGKRTKFQQKDTSQLVVFAKSAEEVPSKENDLAAKGEDNSEPNTSGPTALELNDDTLLESIAFTKGQASQTDLPAELASLKPDAQPQLRPIDQIILLTEATLKDTLSPLDKLTSEEILPFATRVLSDAPTNWQIYSQALLVRSRIEAHRSRTLERSVLQLQVLVDQIIADTQPETVAPPVPNGDNTEASAVPDIQISQWLPKAKEEEKAPVGERLRFVFQLHTPTRWELETELAYAWSGVGSFVSALEIFKRLQLWPEVALCYHSVGQEDKARQVVRRQLFLSAEHGVGLDHYGTDAAEVATEKWDGPERSPPPPHAPRLWCILGDLDRDPACWSHAWEISKKRYARAQRSLGEYYSQKGEFDKAREAYMLATYVNRQNHESWARLGDVDLRQGNWDGAIVAYQQCLSLGEEGDAKSWSNLGSALVSKAEEIIRGKKVKTAVEAADEPDAADEEEDVDVDVVRASGVVEEEDPRNLIMQSLRAYKKAAQLAFSNWQIWDNVLTLAATRLSSPNWPDVLLAVRHILRIRAPSIGEAALDVDILGALVREVISMDRDEKEDAEGEHGVYVPPRGSLASATIRFFDEEVAPLITHRAVLYTLLEQLRLYTRDFAGALDCAEKGWRVSMSDSSSVNKGADGEGESGWLVNEERWREVVRCTEGLCDAFENYGGRIDGDGGDEKKWRLKARSAVRSVLGKAKEEWGHTVEYESLKGRLEELKG